MGMVCFKAEEQSLKPIEEQSFFDLKANDITGKRIDFYVYKNRRAFLLVNVACKSLRSKEYFRMLNQIWDQYKEHGLTILAFPCGQFSNKQPKTNNEIKNMLQNKYDVSFPLFQKIDVNGINTHPVYKYLRNQPQLINKQTGKSKTIPENFTICLLNKDGKLVNYFKPSQNLDELKRSIKRILTQERLTMKSIPSARSIKSIRMIN